MGTLHNYLDSKGIIKVWPSKRTDKITVLNHLVKSFQYNKFYTEKELNKIIDDNHSFNDYFILRRELIDNKLICRTRDGAKYWRGDFLSTIGIETPRATLKYYDNEVIGDLKEVYLSCGYMIEYCGVEHREEYIEQCLREPELPPGGSKEFIKFRSIKSKDTGKVIGFLEYYMGYPNSNTIWIGGLFIHKDFQRMGYGEEVVGEFIKKSKEAGFNTAGLGVHLKNWQALRFWTKQGFNTIGGIYGDEHYGLNTFSTMKLTMKLY
ncbi:GNAT family N-acetyltransferase [Clostridium thermarum]|uniref:GNAT family N-acetyltransferase n=1 Tax=Clostridium thermarum TaxID=1716543 RepID=UPI0011232432|nr:GNAT family N-acetyltransferase [Clostridium thermarum]